MGPLKLRVELERDEHLVADVLGQGRVQLLPKEEQTFTAKEQPGLSFEFVLDSGGKVDKVVVQPAGIFTPDPDAG
jgi:hypothetical protein